MNCPFCHRALTEADAVIGGRYSCPECSATSQEARHGWLPRAQTPVLTQSKAEDDRGLSRVRASMMFSRGANGDTVTRERSCECGRRFTQFQLSERFMLLAEGKSKNAAQLVAKQCPGLFVPVHCPACERRDLGHQSRLDDTRRYDPPFGERHDVA